MRIVAISCWLYCLLEVSLATTDDCSCSDTPMKLGGPTCTHPEFLSHCKKLQKSVTTFCDLTCGKCTCPHPSASTLNITTQQPPQDQYQYNDGVLQYLNIWQIILGTFWLWGILFWLYIQVRICRYRMSSYQRFGVGCLAIFYVPFLVLAPMEFFFRGTPLSVPFALIWIAFSSYHYYFFSMWFIRVRIVQQGSEDQDTIIHVRGDFAIQIISEQQHLNEAERRRQNAEDANRIVLTLPTASFEEREKQGSCSICLEELTEEVGGGDSFVVLPCKHVFHRGCIQTWISTQGRRTNCPLCGNTICGEDNTTPLLNQYP